MSDHVTGTLTLEERMDASGRNGWGRFGARGWVRRGRRGAHECPLRSDIPRPHRSSCSAKWLRARVVGTCMLRGEWTEEQYRTDVESEARIYGSRSEAEAFVREQANWR